MKIKNFKPKFILELLSAGFYKEDFEWADRSLVFGHAFRKDFQVSGRDYTCIIGIHQSYGFTQQHFGKVDIISPIPNELNGEMVVDMWANDGEHSMFNQNSRETNKTLEIINRFARTLQG